MFQKVVCFHCVPMQQSCVHRVFRFKTLYCILFSNAVKAIKSVFTERIARHQVLFVKPLPPPRSSPSPSPSPSLSQGTGCSSCSASQHWENSASTTFITIITKIVITITILILITVYLLLQRRWQLGVAYLEVQLPPNWRPAQQSLQLTLHTSISTTTTAPQH